MEASSMRMRESPSMGSHLHLGQPQANHSLRAAARFIAREVGLAGNSSLGQAQVDEVVDVIQDLINAWVKLYFAKDEAGLKNFADVTLQAALGQLEKKLIARGGQYFVGNNLTWADLHVYMYATDAVDK